jgi:hypothetical protein
MTPKRPRRSRVAHVIRRRRAVTTLGPGGLQCWADDIITILHEAHQAVSGYWHTLATLGRRPRHHRT